MTRRDREAAAARALERLRDEGEVRQEVPPHRALVRAPPAAILGTGEGRAGPLNEAQIGALVGAVVDRLQAAPLEGRERACRVRAWRAWASPAYLWTCPRPRCRTDYARGACPSCGHIPEDDEAEAAGHRRGSVGWIEIMRRTAERLLGEGDPWAR